MSEPNGAVAVMQPYVFPYLGYFHLVEAARDFVFYDDVNFIKRGWINRNTVLRAGNPAKFTVPLTDASQNRPINRIETADLPAFRKSFLTQLQHAYGKAPFYARGRDYVAAVLDGPNRKISELAALSVTAFYDLIGRPKVFHTASLLSPDTRGQTREARLVNITKALGAPRYVNAMGGRELYDKADFAALGVRLDFVRPHLRDYPQTGTPVFVPGLSIIDIVMNVDTDAIPRLLTDFTLE